MFVPTIFRVLVGIMLWFASMPSLVCAESDVGEVVVAQTDLTLWADAPHWWSFRPPKKTEHTVSRGERVKILAKRQLSTIFGQDTWYLIQDASRQEAVSAKGSDGSTGDSFSARNLKTSKIGWVFGGDSRELLAPVPSSANE